MNRTEARQLDCEIRECLEQEKYFYEYEKNGVVYTIDAKNYDDEMICSFAEYVFDVLDWQCSSTFICENDWEEDINEYYSNKFKTKEISI